MTCMYILSEIRWFSCSRSAHMFKQSTASRCVENVTIRSSFSSTAFTLSLAYLSRTQIFRIWQLERENDTHHSLYNSGNIFSQSYSSVNKKLNPLKDPLIQTFVLLGTHLFVLVGKTLKLHIQVSFSCIAFF